MSELHAKKKKARFLNRSGLMPMALTAIFWCLALVYWESLLHLAVYGGFDANYLYGLGFSLSIGGGVAALCGLIPRKAAFWGQLAVSLVLTVLYGSQMVYYFVFGTMYSLAQMGMGGAAITSFWRETLMTMLQKLPWMLALLVPAVVLILLRRFRRDMFTVSCRGYRIPTLLAAAAAYALVIFCLQLGGTGAFSAHSFYYSDSVATHQTAQRFGLLTAFRLESFGSGGTVEEEPEYYAPVETPETTAPAEEIPLEIGETVPQETQPEYNILDIDFGALNEKTDRKKIQAINDYCASLPGTKKNEYTGMLEDYNLIVLCGESFSTAAIDPEVTPTLYKLATEGIIFNNFYNTFPNTTTDGEYALCQGLYPDTTRGKGGSSMYGSRNSYLPFTLGNAFTEQRDMTCYGYHNYKGDYYGRNESHPNMGYQMKFAGAGMKFTNEWPASDLEMMEQSVDDYIDQDQFHAYYMTFSGHYMYTLQTNTMAQMNWDKVKDLPYSEAARVYLGCHVELDKAMEYLMQRLEEKGILDKTAILLVGDHFPYGLKDHQYEELVGHEVDAFSKYKSTLAFWVGGLEENIIVDEYCCNVDILPTLLNLWGLEYDSRMLPGTDVFSDGDHMAVLVNKSVLTDKVWVDANTGKIRYQVEESELPEGYVENLIKQVENKFSVSSDILNQAYYNFVWDKGEVKISRGSW